MEYNITDKCSSHKTKTFNLFEVTNKIFNLYQTKTDITSEAKIHANSLLLKTHQQNLKKFKENRWISLRPENKQCT